MVTLLTLIILCSCFPFFVFCSFAQATLRLPRRWAGFERVDLWFTRNVLASSYSKRLRLSYFLTSAPKLRTSQ